MEHSAQWMIWWYAYLTKTTVWHLWTLLHMSTESNVFIGSCLYLAICCGLWRWWLTLLQRGHWSSSAVGKSRSDQKQATACSFCVPLWVMGQHIHARGTGWYVHVLFLTVQWHFLLIHAPMMFVYCPLRLSTIKTFYNYWTWYGCNVFLSWCYI